jgi:oxygen-independent coproporphyrinogen-3 oxidase
MPISLYVHIPFCIKRCIYCDFVSGAYTPEKAAAYLVALKKEISSIPADRPLSTFHIGGGTPTVLTADQLSDLIKRIFGHFNFTDDHEYTIEANPGTISREKLISIRSAGMNRISIGVQSFDNDELKFLGRIHTGQEAEEAVRLARDAGFENIGVDLIYGIPGQDIETLKHSLEKAVSLKPNHISAYELTVEEGTGLYTLLNSTSQLKASAQADSIIPLNPPLSKGDSYSSLLQRGARGDFSNENVSAKIKLPLEEQIIEMYEYTIDYLASKGYLHYEISNFGLPGSFSRHNLNYWERGDYYGAGVGAHSFVNNTRSHNTAELERYLDLLSGGKKPVEHSEEITSDEAVSEAIFLGLRKTEGINIEAFSRRYKINLPVLYEKEIKELKEAGLIEIGMPACRQAGAYETDIRLTRKGLILSNEVFVRFI